MSDPVQKQTIRFASYNNLFPNWSSQVLKHAPKWEQRGPRIIKKIQDLDADIIGLQEQSKKFYPAFAKKMKDLGYSGVFQYHNSGKHDGCAIFYRKDKFELLSHRGVFYYTGTSRVVQVAQFRPRNGNGIFYFCNTHLMYLHKPAVKELNALIPVLKECRQSAPVVLGGDLNLHHQDKLLDPLKAAGFSDILTEAGAVQGSHLCSEPGQGKGRGKKFLEPVRIDHIFASGHVGIKEAAVAGDSKDLGLTEPSDHLPVTADLDLPFSSEKFEEIHLLENPFDFEENKFAWKIFENFNSAFSETHAIPHAKYQAYAEAIIGFFEASCKTPTPCYNFYDKLLPDGTLNAFLDNPDLRSLVQEMIFRQSTLDLLAMHDAPTSADMKPLCEKLPKAMRDCLYKSVEILMKRGGATIEGDKYGRSAFRRENGKDCSKEIRKQAIQLVLLEQVIIPLFKEEEVQAALFFFESVDESFKKQIFEHLHAIEKAHHRASRKPGYAKNAFLDKNHFSAPVPSRIKAIKSFIAGLSK